MVVSWPGSAAVGLPPFPRRHGGEIAVETACTVQTTGRNRTAARRTITDYSGLVGTHLRDPLRGEGRTMGDPPKPAAPSLWKNRKLLGLAVLSTGLVAGPYLHSHWQEWSPALGGGAALEQSPAAATLSTWGVPQEEPTAVLAGPVEWDLAEIINLDVSKHWVFGHWPRVSTSLSSLDLEGLRVPLVTGGGAQDLAGSLTYYFNRQQRVERIVFRGTTGDAGPLVALLQMRFGFQRQLTDNPQLYLYRPRKRGRVQSELRIEPRGVVRRDAPQERFDVWLTLQRGA